jgi:hypothetical protein
MKRYMPWCALLLFFAVNTFLGHAASLAADAPASTSAATSQAQSGRPSTDAPAKEDAKPILPTESDVDAPAIWIPGRERSVTGEISSTKRVELSLDGYVGLKLDQPLAPLLEDKKSGAKMGLYINDFFFKDLTPEPLPGYHFAAKFHLSRTPLNSEQWGYLFSNKKLFSADPERACEKDPDQGIKLAAGFDNGRLISTPVYACLVYFPAESSRWLLLLVATALLVGSIVLAFTSEMLRDVGIPIRNSYRGNSKMPSDLRRPWSLARFQMALWFVSILCGGLLIYAVTGSGPPIPNGLLILMGLGAGTAVSAYAIDAKGTGTLADYVSLKMQVREGESSLKNIEKDLQATTDLVQKEELRQQLGELTAQLEAIRAKKIAYEVEPSRGFIKDLLFDGGGVGFHRLQVFAWTMAYWSIFIYTLFNKFTLTDFDTTQLVLMGISGATYLGFKLQEPAKDITTPIPTSTKTPADPKNAQQTLSGQTAQGGTGPAGNGPTAAAQANAAAQTEKRE